MKIVVLVKHVPEATAAWGYAEDFTLDRANVEGRLSELDEYAVEQAIVLAEKGLPAAITYLTMGPAKAVDGLRKALAMGGDDAVHVQDSSLHGSDALTTSLVLAKAIERIGFDLVLCGMASTDADMSVVPAMVAERLGVPQLTFAANLAVAGSSVTVLREADGETQTVVATLPAVVSVTDQTSEARYPSFKAIMAGKRKPVATWSLADLGVAPGAAGAGAAATAVRGAARRPARQAGTVVVDKGEGAAALADFLVAQKLL
jgi:electron transfer flavoprotein beta subunit